MCQKIVTTWTAYYTYADTVFEYTFDELLGGHSQFAGWLIPKGKRADMTAEVNRTSRKLLFGTYGDYIELLARNDAKDFAKLHGRN